MDDPGPARAADARYLRSMGQRRGGQRSVDPSRAGMGHHAGGLVHHQDVGVLEDDAKRDRFGLETILRRRGNGHLHPLARLDPVRGLDGAAVHESAARRDEGLDAHARQLGEPPGQPLIEPRPGAVALHHVGHATIAGHGAAATPRLSWSTGAR